MRTRSGVLVFGTGGAYIDEAYRNDVTLGARVEPLADERALRAVFAPGVPTGAALDRASGYLNRDGGWAAASDGVAHAIGKVRALGGRVLGGRRVAALVKTNGVTSGVRCADGAVIEADLVVVATGSWTASTFPELDLGERCLATGSVLSIGGFCCSPKFTLPDKVS